MTPTIQHSRSDKKEFGEWIHPDMVGCYFPIDDWKPEVVEFSASIGSTIDKKNNLIICQRIANRKDIYRIFP